MWASALLNRRCGQGLVNPRTTEKPCVCGPEGCSTYGSPPRVRCGGELQQDGQAAARSARGRRLLAQCAGTVRRRATPPTQKKQTNPCMQGASSPPPSGARHAQLHCTLCNLSINHQAVPDSTILPMKQTSAAAASAWLQPPHPKTAMGIRRRQHNPWAREPESLSTCTCHDARQLRGLSPSQWDTLCMVRQLLGAGLACPSPKNNEPNQLEKSTPGMHRGRRPVSLMLLSGFNAHHVYGTRVDGWRTSAACWPLGFPDGGAHAWLL